MRSIFLSMILVTRFCFGFSELTKENLKKSWDFASNYDYQNAIDHMTFLINDPETANIDRVHYHIARSQFFSMNMDKEAQSYDMIILGNLIRKYPECMEEKIKYYIIIDEG